MPNPINTVFTAHPAAVGESYLQHMTVAARFGFWLLTAAGAALLHALIPALCERTASRIIKSLHDQMERRH